MTTAIENRRYWDTPTKAIVSTLLLSFTLLTTVSIIPLTLKQVKNNQEARIQADTIYTTPLVTPISSNQVVISFSTKVPVTSKLNLISPLKKEILSVSNDPQTSHAITLKNLKPQTNYTYSFSINPVNQSSITTNSHSFTTP